MILLDSTQWRKVHTGTAKNDLNQIQNNKNIDAGVKDGQLYLNFTYILQKAYIHDKILLNHEQFFKEDYRNYWKQRGFFYQNSYFSDVKDLQLTW